MADRYDYWNTGKHFVSATKAVRPVNLQILPDLEQGSEEWLDQRRGLVTASVVGQLITTRKLGAIDYQCPECGAPVNDPCRSKRNPDAAIKTLHTERAEYARNQSSSTVIEPASNDTSRDLTMLLVAERITGYTEPTYVNADMERGHEGEVVAREKYAEHYAPVTEVGFMVREENGIKIGFSPDGLVGDEGLLEIKSPRQKTHLKTVLADGVPIEHMAQIQCGLLVSDREWLDFISYNGGMKLWVRRVYPQRAWFDAITKAVSAFEANAAEMQRIYDDRTNNMPMTERRIEDFGLVI